MIMALNTEAKITQLLPRAMQLSARSGRCIGGQTHTIFFIPRFWGHFFCAADLRVVSAKRLRSKLVAHSNVSCQRDVIDTVILIWR